MEVRVQPSKTFSQRKIYTIIYVEDYEKMEVSLKN